MARNGIAPVDLAYEDFYREGGDAEHLREVLAAQGLDLGRRERAGTLVRQDLARDRGGEGGELGRLPRRLPQPRARRPG